MNILITGARAPIAAELAHRFVQAKEKVYLADSFLFPISRFVTGIEKYFRIGPINKAPLSFFKEIEKIVVEYKIDQIIPTSEESFYLSFFKDRFPKTCHLFVLDFKKMARFHHKGHVMEEAKDCGISLPQTFCVKNEEEASHWFQENREKLCDFMAKPAYSRFASFIEMNLTNSSLSRFKKHYPIVIQEKLKGEEFCSYTMAMDGVVIGHLTYRPKYRAKLGASIFFEPLEHKKIESFVTQFVAKHQLTGQIAFDYIENNQGMIKILECNPRGTSGLHLLEETKTGLPLSYQKNPLMLGLPMFLYAYSNIKRAGFLPYIKDSFKAKTVFGRFKNPFLLTIGQVISFSELIVLSLIKRKGILEVSTDDIEWNGETIHE